MAGRNTDGANLLKIYVLSGGFGEVGDSEEEGNEGDNCLGDFQNGHFSVATHAATFPLRDLLICEYFYHPSR